VKTTKKKKPKNNPKQPHPTEKNKPQESQNKPKKKTKQTGKQMNFLLTSQECVRQISSLNTTQIE